jgi:cytochrome c-type biogenesis protein
LALPFFLSALAINSFFQFSAKLRRYVETIHTVGGVLLIVVGVLLITDYLTILNSYFLRFTPTWLLQRL